MKLKAALSWDPKIKFENLSLVDIVLSFENEDVQEFKGQLKRADTALDYLWNLYVRATNDYDKGRKYVGRVVKSSKGKRVYQMPVKVTGKGLDDIRRTAERIQKKYFISPRNEEVTDEEYSTFYGSSNGLWSVERCSYPRGDFAETLRQTVYDMEHRYPDIYKWTNVPRWYLLERKMESEPEFVVFVKKEIEPLIVNWEKERKTVRDIEEIKKRFNAMAEVAEKYKRGQGIERL